VYRTAVPRLQALSDQLKSEGGHVTLRPETMGKAALLGSLEDILILSQTSESIEPCIDFPHLYARTGDGSLNTQKDWESVLRRYSQSLGENSLKRLHIHLSGIEYTQKGERKHLPIQESDFDLFALLKALKHFECAGRMLCESPLMEEDALHIKHAWESLK
jgi:deoxyribonuclease-4